MSPFNIAVEGVTDEEGQAYPPLRHMVHVRGVSILPHVRKNQVRRVSFLITSIASPPV